MMAGVRTRFPKSLRKRARAGHHLHFASHKSTWRSHVADNHLLTAARSGLCRVAALLRRVHHAREAQGDGPGRSAPRHRYSQQLPVLRARRRSFQASSAPICPASFATFAAYGDFATGVLAMLALLTVRIRPLFWSFVVAFNIVGIVDILPTITTPFRPTSGQAGQVGCRVRDPGHLRALADDHERRRVLFPAASEASIRRSSAPRPGGAAQQGPRPVGRSNQRIAHDLIVTLDTGKNARDPRPGQARAEAREPAIQLALPTR